MFQVEDTLFRVPRHPFVRESAVFRDMFTLPVPNDTTPDGVNDDQPLQLDGVAKKDFEHLLSIMFPECVIVICRFVSKFTEQTGRRPWSRENVPVIQFFSVIELFSVFSLSTMWEMDALADVVFRRMSTSSAEREEWVAVLDICHLPKARSLAIQKITHFLTGVDKILMGRKYKVKKWLVGGLCDLVTRSASFSDEKEDQLGFTGRFGNVVVFSMTSAPRRQDKRSR